MYNKDDVNKKNTRTWVKVNEDSRAKINRDYFCKSFGGEFKQIGKNFQWEDIQQEPEKRIMVFERNGEVFEVSNIMEFCREHKLTKSALYEVVSGKRKHHKNFKFIAKK